MGAPMEKAMRPSCSLFSTQNSMQKLVKDNISIPNCEAISQIVPLRNAVRYD